MRIVNTAPGIETVPPEPGIEDINLEELPELSIEDKMEISGEREMLYALEETYPELFENKRD